jgi:succinate dehydrogenase hydrophobic anchor subunit
LTAVIIVILVTLVLIVRPWKNSPYAAPSQLPATGAYIVEADE